MKTLKQIADEIGVPKQQVYRYVKAECINEVHHEAFEARQSKSVKYYNEAAESAIKAYFQGKVQPIEAHHEVHREAEPESLKSVIEAMQAGHAAEVKRLVDQLDQLRQDHREELDRIQAGHAAELDRIQEAHRQQLDDLRAQLEEVKRDLTEERQHSRDTAERLAQLADQAQRLQLAQMQPPAALPEEITPQEKPTLWQRLFGKK